MRQLLKQFFVYGLGSTIGKFLSLFLLPIYASVFTPEDYGSLDFIQTITSIVSIFGMIQVETGLQRYYYEYEDMNDRNRLVSTSFLFSFILSLFITILILLSVPFINDYYFEGKYAVEMVLSILVIIPSNLLAIIFVDFRFRKKTFLFTIINVVMVLVTALSSIYAVKFMNMGIMGIIACSTITYYIIFIICFFIWYQQEKCLCFSRGLLKQMLSFGLPKFPARLGSISNSYINRFFMIGLLSVQAIGIYAVSLKIASGMQLILSAFQLAWLPHMYELLTRNNHRIELLKSYKWILLILSYIVFLLALFSKDIVLLLTNEKYVEAAKYAPLLSLYYALYILKEVVDIGVQKTNKTIYTSYIYILSSIINVLLLCLLTPRFGLYGVSCALLFSNAMLFISTMIVSEKLYPIGFPKKPTIFMLLCIVLIVFIFPSLDFSLYMKFGISFLFTLCLSVLFHKQMLHVSSK